MFPIQPKLLTTNTNYTLTMLDYSYIRKLITSYGYATTTALSDYLLIANNLSDLSNVSDARDNLGLGTLATQDGTFSGISSGTNTGDQPVFKTISVSGQSDVVADSTTDTLTLVAGTNITITTDASTDSITINTTGGGGSYTDEEAQDAVGTILVDSSTIDFTYSDATPSITASVIQSGLDHGSIGGLADDDHTQYHTNSRALTWLGTRSTTDLPEGSNLYYTDERVDDRAASLIQNGTGISWSYNDGANTLTPTISLSSFSTTNLSEGSNLYFTDERAQDAVGAALSAEFTYNDGANTISINSISNTKISGLGTLSTQNGTFSGTSSGTNTGDQNLFSTIAVSGQSNVVADSTSDTLTLQAGTGITLTTDATNDIITISSTSSGISWANVFAVSSLRI